MVNMVTVAIMMALFTRLQSFNSLAESFLLTESEAERCVYVFDSLDNGVHLEVKC